MVNDVLFRQQWRMLPKCLITISTATGRTKRGKQTMQTISKMVVKIDRIITGTGFVTRTCMIHSLVDFSSFSNIRTNDLETYRMNHWKRILLKLDLNSN